MRRALGMLVVVAAAAVAAGLAIPAAAVRVGSSTLSQPTFDSELAAIQASPSFQCYLEAEVFSQSKVPGPTVHGVSPQTRSSAAAVVWADHRVTVLAITSYVEAHNPGAFSPSALAVARAALASAIVSTLNTAFTTQAASPFSCPAALASSSTIVPGATILATLPAWLQDELVRSEAANLGLIALLPASVRIAESGPGLRAWFDRHASRFDTTCISDIAVPTQAAASSIATKLAAGLSFADAARRYSRDTTNKKGGVIGCFSPTSPQWPAVVKYVGSTPTGKLALWPIGGYFVIYEPTRRTPNRFASIASAVQTGAHAINVQNAVILGLRIKLLDPVSVGSWLGSWSPNQIGGQVVGTPAPPVAAVVNPAANTPTG